MANFILYQSVVYSTNQMTKSNYITKEGYVALSNELKHLWQTVRPQATQALSEAAALGDRSENAEYIYGKKHLREIDRRIRFLTRRLRELKIIEYHPNQEGKVCFGAWVKIEDDNGNIIVYRLVGTDELNTNKKWISIDSPVARALIGHKTNDKVRVSTPGGLTYFHILTISYDTPTEDQYH